MSVDIREVEAYDDERLQELMLRNLGRHISSEAFCGAGDPAFHTEAKKIRIGAFAKGELIGLSWGASQSKSRFMMNVSLVEEEYRAQGIYTRMLDLMLKLTSAYDEIDSYHHVFNNTIIATKLKRSFYIVGVDQSILIGPRVRLRRYNNSALLKAMRFRVGLEDSPFEDPKE